MSHGPSNAERRLSRELDRLGLTFETQHPVLPDGALRPYLIDIAFARKRIAVEVEGPHHATSEHHRRDIVRGNFLRERGWVLHKVHADDCSPRRVQRTAARIARLYRDTEDSPLAASEEHARGGMRRVSRAVSSIFGALLRSRLLLWAAILACYAMLLARGLYPWRDTATHGQLALVIGLNCAVVLCALLLARASRQRKGRPGMLAGACALLSIAWLLSIAFG